MVGSSPVSPLLVTVGGGEMDSVVLLVAVRDGRVVLDVVPLDKIS